MSDSGSNGGWLRQYAMSWWDFSQFLLALFFGIEYRPEPVSPWKAPDALYDAEPEAFRLIIEEGRRQLDSQAARFEDVQRRAQQLLTLALALVAFIATSVTLSSGGAARTGWGTGLAVLGLVLSLTGGVGAAAVSVVKATFTGVDTTEASSYLELRKADVISKRLALDYAGAVILGETTVASRITHFRRSVRLVLAGAYVGILGLLL